MIVLDPRIGSGELESYLRAYDEEIRVNKLDCGDAYWWGSGPDGPVKVGVERKVLGDLVSSMRDNRLSGFQLPKLLKTYPFRYLLIEGVYRVGEGGIIEIYGGKKKRGMGRATSVWTPLRAGSQPILFREVDHYITTLEHRAGFNVAYTGNKEQTAAWIVSRYKWWAKDWDKHDAHEAIYAPYEQALQARRGSTVIRRAGSIEMVAAQFPGVARKAYEFRKLFGSVRKMVNATPMALAEVEGIGKKGALVIDEWLDGKRG